MRQGYLIMDKKKTRTRLVWNMKEVWSTLAVGLAGAGFVVYYLFALTGGF